MSRLFFSPSPIAKTLLLVTALVFIGCGVDKANRPDGPVADFTWSSQSGPSVFAFHNLSVNADRYYWRFPGGLFSTNSDPVFGFSGSGVQSVTLIATETSTSRVDSLTRTLTIMPSRFLLDSVIVEQISFTNSSGNAWDDLTGPDLYFILKKPSGRNESESFSYPFEDTRPEFLPVGWKFSSAGYYLSDWDFNYSIDILDKDGNSPSDYYNDTIGSVSFRIRALVESNGYGRIFTLQSGTIRVRIVVKWE